MLLDSLPNVSEQATVNYTYTTHNQYGNGAFLSCCIPFWIPQYNIMQFTESTLVKHMKEVDSM